jgi:hypothetical protein
VVEVPPVRRARYGAASQPLVREAKWRMEPFGFSPPPPEKSST